MDWSDRLKGSPFNKPASLEAEPPRLRAIDLVIGIDYGTRFTKIAIGNGRGRQVWEDKNGRRLIPSVVNITADGTVITYPDIAPAGCDKVEYLKMLLANPKADVFRSVRSQISGKPISDLVRPLAAAFLCGLVKHIQRSILADRSELASRGVNWFLNVGAPVAHCDSNIHAFQEVAAVAFEWAQKGHPTKIKINDLCASYHATLRTLDLTSSPASIVPELTATLHEFVKDPNRADNLYGLFDVGGGTLDGTIFRVNRSGEGAPLVIHAANVDSLGTIAISRTMLAEIFSKLPQYIEAPLLGADEVPSIALPLTEELAFREKQSVYNEIQNLVASVIFKTKKHLYGELFSPRTDATKKELPPLRIFLSGGGATSGWYKSCIERSYADRDMHTWGLTGMRAEIVGAPGDYKHSDYARFIIALGLADFSAALVDARLPKQMKDAELPIGRQMPSMVTKDQM